MLFTVAVVQLEAGISKKGNFEKINTFLERVAKEKPNLIVLPEHWNWCGSPLERKNHSEDLIGSSNQFLQGLAKKYQCTILSGSISEKHPQGLPPFNTSLLIFSDGRFGKPYRKIHLFDAEVGVGHRESETTTAGSEVVVDEIIFGKEKIKVGLSVCYDLRFPELYRKLSFAGAEILFVPANFTAVTGPPHWGVLARARAIENQCFVVAVGQTGKPGNYSESHGHSMVIDPWGEVLVEMKKEEGVAVAHLDFDKLHQVRQKMPVGKHRKI